ncbi:MAG TPA: carbohydrate ABC transporter permease [Gammaproteobacteria bacterium]
MRARGRIALTVAGAAIVLYALFPVVWILMLSLKADAQTPGFLPREWTLENYVTVLESGLFLSALRNSIGISLIATTASVTLATFAAYAVARLEFKGRRGVLATALAIAMFPTISLVPPLFDLWRAVGLYDTWLGLVIPYMSFTLPLSIWILVAFFREIPWEIEQAARMDGATAFQAFRLVIVPLAAPGVFTAAILTFFFAWNDFVFGISLTASEAARPVPAALAFFTGESFFEQPAAQIAAASIVVTIPVIVLVLLFQRRIVAGLTAGAVKG